MRFAPPLVITKEQVDWAMERIGPILSNGKDEILPVRRQVCARVRHPATDGRPGVRAGRERGADTIMLGGGNPSHIPRSKPCLRERMARMLRQAGDFERLVATTPPGRRPALSARRSQLLRREFDWPVTEANIA